MLCGKRYFALLGFAMASLFFSTNALAGALVGSSLVKSPSVQPSKGSSSSSSESDEMFEAEIYGCVDNSDITDPLSCSFIGDSSSTKNKAAATKPNSTPSSTTSNACTTAVSAMNSTCVASQAQITQTINDAVSGASSNNDPMGCLSFQDTGSSIGSQAQSSLASCSAAIGDCSAAGGTNCDCSSGTKILSNMSYQYQIIAQQSQQSTQNCSSTMSELSNSMSSALGNVANNAALQQQQAALAAQCAANPAACGGYSTFCANPANSGATMCVSMGNNSAGSTSPSYATGAGADGSFGGVDPGAGIASMLNSPAQSISASAPQPTMPAAGGGGFGGAALSNNVPASGSGKKPGAGGPRMAEPPKSLYGGLLTNQNGPTVAHAAPSSSADKKVYGGKFASDPASPDFSKFAPNMKYDPRRGIASTPAANRDGITGPETNLFDKVRNQYQAQSSRGNFLNQ
jgi:hypothetical protein